jgi:hypothetical protein
MSLLHVQVVHHFTDFNIYRTHALETFQFFTNYLHTFSVSSSWFKDRRAPTAEVVEKLEQFREHQHLSITELSKKDRMTLKFMKKGNDT